MTWHTNVTIGGTLYPTRTRAPRGKTSGTDFSDLLGGLTPQQCDLMDAVHEAGHAVAALAAGGHVHHARIGDVPGSPTAGGEVECCGLTEGHAFAAFSGAGERAADRWLREMGLWTVERAVAAEIGARSDRRRFLAVNGHIGYGDRDRQDYRTVHDVADALLGRHWQAVTAVAAALTEEGLLDGDTVAALAGLPNGPHHTD